MGEIKRLPSVTIHVTVKNAEETIKKCIGSLLKLDYPNKKIYVTEAYSTDKTYEILKQFGNKITLERVRGSAPKAHNHAFKKIKSDLLAFTDADCVVDRNWLKNLVKVFNSPDVIAAGGFCKTPKNVNNLQRLIGIELEDRFHRMPRYVNRLPTMNFCVRTNAVKKVKMNESLTVTFEADWGSRLSKLGKIAYVPEAVVYHYHRSTLKNFFKQQLNYGKYVVKTPQVYIKSRQFGDYLSKPIMGLQLIVFNLFIISLIASAFSPPMTIISSSLIVVLLILYLLDILNFSKNIFDIFSYLGLFFIRTFAWTLGILSGISEIMRGK